MLSLQEISDRLEIQELLVRYASAIDQRQYDRLADVFTPDAEIDYQAYGGPTGRFPEIKLWLAEALAPFPAFQHLVANPEIRIDGDDATGRIMCFNPMVIPPATPEAPPQICYNGLWYIDRYIRTQQGWRISYRSEEASFSDNFPVQAA